MAAGLEGDAGREVDLPVLTWLADAAASAGSFTFGPGLFDGGRASAQSLQVDGSVQSARPNILVIKVDQLRFPKVFPPGINNAGDFLKQFMPNLYQLWQHGVKFAGHYTAASACTPARGTIIIGLASAELARQPSPPRPASRLGTALAEPRVPHTASSCAGSATRRPTSASGMSPSPARDRAGWRSPGFDGVTWPDPTGSNLQGTVGDENNYYTDRNGSTICALSQ